MRLAVFTMHYPYGCGEEFFSDEIRVAENEFDEITIVSLEKIPQKPTKYIPHNAKVINARENYSKTHVLRTGLKCAFSIRAIKETICGVKERGIRSFPNVVKSIILTESAISYLQGSESKWLSDPKGTIFYSYWLDAPATYLARNKKRLQGLCLSRAHGGDCFFDRAFHPFRKEQLEKLDYVLPISEAGRQDILMFYADDCLKIRDKIKTSYLGIRKQSDAMNPYRWSIVKRIVTCSNVIPLKRLDLLIDALSILNDIKICWTHFGSGYLMDEIKAKAVECLDKKPNISYEFMGHRPKQEVLNLYETQSIDLFINCSDAEGIPVSAMEAMAYGIPVIARDVGAISELIENSCGILLPNKVDAQEITDAICEVLRLDKDIYMNKRMNAAERVSARFSADQNYFQFYSDLMKIC